MRTRLRYDRDMDCMVEIRDQSNYYVDEPKGPTVISDDMGGGVRGVRAMYRKDRKHFDSKSRYKADVKAHGLEIVGNETNFESQPATQPRDMYGSIVSAAYEQFSSNWNGTADRVKAEEQRTRWRRDNG
jgi:hypothetical protein